VLKSPHPSIREEIAMTVQNRTVYASLCAIVACSLSLAGCSTFAKTVVQAGAERVREKTGIGKSQAELRQELKEDKEAYDRKTGELEKQLKEQKEKCEAQRAELEKHLREVKDEFAHTEKELKKALEDAEGASQ